MPMETNPPCQLVSVAQRVQHIAKAVSLPTNLSSTSRKGGTQNASCVERITRSPQASPKTPKRYQGLQGQKPQPGQQSAQSPQEPLPLNLIKKSQSTKKMRRSSGFASLIGSLGKQTVHPARKTPSKMMTFKNSRKLRSLGHHGKTGNGQN